MNKKHREYAIRFLLRRNLEDNLCRVLEANEVKVKADGRIIVTRSGWFGSENSETYDNFCCFKRELLKRNGDYYHDAYKNESFFWWTTEVGDRQLLSNLDEWEISYDIAVGNK